MRAEQPAGRRPAVAAPPACPDPRPHSNATHPTPPEPDSYDFQARRYGKCELLEAVPGLLTEFTLRSTNPIRTLTHRTLLRWLPEARAYRQRVQVRGCGAGRAVLRRLLVGDQGSRLADPGASARPASPRWPCLLLPQTPAPLPRPPTSRTQIVHRWWRVLLASVRATDVAAADAAGDTGLRACFARLPLSDELLIPQLAVYLIAG